MNDCDFTRVVTKDNEECFLLTKLKRGGHEGLELTLCHEGKVWTGSVSEDDMDNLSARLKIQFTKYVKETIGALTNSTDDKSGFQYQLKRHNDNAEFAWKKHIPDDDITFQLGSVTLKPRADSALVITRIYNHCIEGIQDLKTRIHNLETDNQRLSQERMNALKRLEKCVVAKEELENDLYSKFSDVLNKKKEKIRELKDEVENGSSSTNTESNTASVTQSSNNKRPRQENNKAGGSDVDENTDDEIPKTKSRRTAGGSKKQENVGDDSLILNDDEEEEDSVQTTTRTRRQRGRGQKKQTPAKPVLPRIGSGDSTPGSEKKSRLRKGGSGASNKSNDSVEADDLFDDL